MANFCPTCGSERDPITQSCWTCAMKAREAEQLQSAYDRTAAWIEEHVKPTFPLNYQRWKGNGNYGRPEWWQEHDLDHNIVVRYINELHERLRDMEFKLEEMREELDDHRSSECGSPKG